MPDGWEWDETLFLGSAAFYTRGRLSYSTRLAHEIATRLSLDGAGRLLDLGCGPGTVTLPFARYFTEVIGVDPDHGMIAEAERRAGLAGITNARWACARAEELTADLVGTFQVATIAQSFHWMDRSLVAAFLHEILAPSGWLLHIAEDKTYSEAGEATTDSSDSPPYREIEALVKCYLGPNRRAGQGVLLAGTPGGQAQILTRAGLPLIERFTIPGEGAIDREIGDLVAWVYSRSSSAPHLFGDRLSEFEAELRTFLHQRSPDRPFRETLPDTIIEMYRRTSAGEY